MKQLVYFSFFFGITAAFGQTTTNAPESTYQFTKIAQHGTTAVEDQGMTSTCWCFSALSFFESELMRQGVQTPDLLAEMYIVRKAYEEKADRFIRMDGKINFAEGGAFHDIPFIMKKYGVVPKEVYTGQPNGPARFNHEEAFAVLNSYVQAILSQVQKDLTHVYL